MPSSSQVLDHQLIFHIKNGLRQSHYWQNKGEERKIIEVVGEDRRGEDTTTELAFCPGPKQPFVPAPEPGLRVRD
jgi:hypothetical protein